MPHLARHTPALAALLAALHAGCAVTCSEAACGDGIELTVQTADGRSISTFTGTAVIDGERHEFACDGGLESSAEPSVVCRSDGVLLAATHAQSVEIVLTAAEGTVALTFDPDFEPVYLSGEECGPYCHVAEVLLVVE